MDKICCRIIITIDLLQINMDYLHISINKIPAKSGTPKKVSHNPANLRPSSCILHPVSPYPQKSV